TAGVQSITATDTLNGALAGSLGGITVQPAAARRFVISAPASAPFNKPVNITVTVQDAFCNIVTPYTPPLHLTTPHSNAALPPNPPVTAADNSTHVLAVTFKKRGAQTVTATDISNGTISGISNPIQVF